MIFKFLEADICNTMFPVYSLIRQTQSKQIPDENLVHLFLKVHSERKKKQQQQLQRLGFGDNGQQNAKDKMEGVQFGGKLEDRTSGLFICKMTGYHQSTVR
jgi:hypothetical protein